MKASEFPNKFYVTFVHNVGFVMHSTLEEACKANGTDRTLLAEYNKGRVVEAKLVADVQCEIGG